MDESSLIISDHPKATDPFLEAATARLGIRLAAFDGYLYRREPASWRRLEEAEALELMAEFLRLGITLSSRGVAKPLALDAESRRHALRCALDCFRRDPSPWVRSVNGRLVDFADLKRHVSTSEFFIGELNGSETGVRLSEWLADTVRADHVERLLEALAWACFGDPAGITTHAMPFLYGRPRAGKGTVLELLADFAGPFTGQISAFSDYDFAYQGLQRVALAICADYTPEQSGELHRDLLTFAAQEPLTIQRKNQPAITRRAPRVVLASNTDRGFRDVTGAMSGRLQVIEFRHSHSGAEDPELLTRLRRDLPSFGFMLAAAHARFCARKRFSVSNRASCEAAGVFGDGQQLTEFLSHCETGGDYPDWQCPSPRELQLVLKALADANCQRPMPVTALLKALERRGVSLVQARDGDVRRRVVRGLRPLALAEADRDTPWAAAVSGTTVREGRMAFQNDKPSVTTKTIEEV